MSGDEVLMLQNRLVELGYLSYAEGLAPDGLYDEATTAAVAGSLAGIAWGERAIPAAWRMLLPRRGDMEELLQTFYYSCITKK